MVFRSDNASLARLHFFSATVLIGWMVWWYCAPVLLFPMLRGIVEFLSKQLSGDTVAAIISSPHGHWILNTQLLRPGSHVELFDLVLDPRHFTLALPLLWGFTAMTTPPKRFLTAAVIVTLLGLIPMTVALCLQTITSIPKSANGAGVEHILVLDVFGQSMPRYYKAPPFWAISGMDAARVVLVYANLFIFPVIIPLWYSAWTREHAASRPLPAARSPSYARKNPTKKR